MNTKQTPLWIGLVTLGSVAAAQTVGNDEPAMPQELPKQPSQSTDSSGLVSVPRPQRAIPERITGPAESGPVQIDDSIPLPGQALVEAGADGDHVVGAASGDPFFLSFAAGDKRPDENELIDPALATALEGGFVDGRPLAQTYAFVMFQKRITPERVAQLEELGLRVLGFHPHYSLKVAGDLSQLDAASLLDSVRWVGTADAWQKLHPALATELEAKSPSELVDLWVNVFESDTTEDATIDVLGVPTLVSPAGIEQLDPSAGLQGAKRVQSNGWMHQSLVAHGAIVQNYVDEVQAFRVLVPASLVESLTQLDFVQFIDGYGTPTTAHDESRAMILSDRTSNSYDGGTNSAAIVGLIDTGYELAHDDLNNIWGVGWDCTASSGGVWDDTDGHGSHVAGSILGTGDVLADHEGNASGLAHYGGNGRFRQLRFLNGDNPCSWTMDAVYDVFENDYNDGTNISPKPHAINCSWGTTMAGSPIGSETQARLVDTQVYSFDQVFVFAAGNEGSGAGTLRIEPSAKNALTVGNVLDYNNATVGDPGTIWTSSSRGPTGDGRWKPNVSAPGRWIRSVNALVLDGYTNKSGTSMAAPHVTGTIGQLCDRWSYLRHRPATTASLLMATAITKDNAVITSETSAHLDSYGAGRANSYKAAYDTVEFGVLYNNTLNLTSGSSFQFGDFTVTSDMTRIVAVMHYVEPAASAGAGSVLINDWDLWLDREPIDSAGNSGEYFAQQSSVNNTEIRIIDNPAVGAWRWKAYPDSVVGSVKMSVTIHAIYGDTTPSGSLAVGVDDQYVQPNDLVTLTAQAVNPEYVASAVFLDTSGSSHSLQTSSTTLDDGTVTDLLDNPHGGYDVTLGDIMGGDNRVATWTTRYTTEGVKAFTVNARSDNWVDRTATVNVTVDGTAPALPTNLHSTSHATGVWSNDPSVDYAWTASTDNLSGLSGYGIFTSVNSPGSPSAVQDIGAVTSLTDTVASTGTYYFNLRPVDRSGNWNASYSNTGPYLIDLTVPSAPPSLHSTTHSVGVPTCESQVTMDWNASSDSHSGVSGYSVVWSHSTNPVPDTIIDTAATIFTTTVPESGLGWYFGVRARDAAGNWGPTSVSGPYFIDLGGSSTYCVGAVNSTGLGGAMGYSGSLSISANDMTLRCTNLPSNQTCIFYYGAGQAQVAFGNGFRCVGGQLFRYAPVSTTTGLASQPVDYTNPPFAPGQITSGSTWNFQCWYRDPLAGGAFFNLSNGLELTFCP